jgi:hypothetical protein
MAQGAPLRHGSRIRRTAGSDRATGPYSPNDDVCHDPTCARLDRRVDCARVRCRHDAARRQSAPLEQADADAGRHAGAGAVAARNPDAIEPSLIRWCG